MLFSHARGVVTPRRAWVWAGAVVCAFVFALGLVADRAAMATSLPAGAPAQKVANKPSKLPGKTAAKKSPGAARVTGSVPPVVLFHINHRETLRLRLTDERGKPLRGLQSQMNRFLRCHYTKRQHAMNPRLTRLIYEVGRHYPGRRIEVVSGYRHPKVAKNKHSPHMKGLACDMRVSGVKNTELRDFFRQRFKSVGVGYYPNSSFVHLDVRKGASAFWIDYSGPGERALYSKNALDDLRSGRAERWRRTTIDPAWVDLPDDDGEEPGNEAGPEEGDEVNVEPDVESKLESGQSGVSGPTAAAE